MQNRREFLKLLLAGGTAAFVLPQISFGQTTPDVWKTEYPRILARIKPPKFRKKDYLITKYGALPDGKTDCTQAFARAIEDCHKKGGGRVVVSKGVWLTGPIHLKSNVNLHISKDAVVKFTTDTKQYQNVFSRWEGMELMNYSPLIYAFEQENIAVTGTGTLDGQADNENWWYMKGNKRDGWSEGMPNQFAARARLHEVMRDNVPVEKRIFGEGSYLRPQFIQPYRCKNVLIEDIKIINSPMWEVHPVLCENVTVRRLRVDTHGPNNDGCNPESCKDVLIEDCYFDTGDDCIAIKSGRNEDGRRINIPSENIIVRNCNFKAGHGGITVGSECSGGFRNLFAENNRLDSPELWTALRIKNNASRGGKIENLYFRNITIGKVSRSAIEIDFNYEEGAKGEYIPMVKNLRVENLTAQDCNKAVDLQGLDKAPLYDIFLKNCDFGKVTGTNIVKNVNNLTLENVKMNGTVVDKLV